MKRNLMILALMAVFTFVAVPMVSMANAQERTRGNHSQSRRNDNDWNRDRNNDWGKSHKKNAHGYKNYGQYRRTQVGNRRSRYVRRYYTSSNGTRLSRLVRIFY
jgi:Ni/Co efflux regulator RcnB